MPGLVSPIPKPTIQPDSTKPIDPNITIRGKRSALAMLRNVNASMGPPRGALFIDGTVIDCASSTYPGQDGFYHVGCPSGGRFVDNLDGTVTDTCTGLMWQKNTAPGTFLWQAALGYCEGLSLGGHDDWRLPNLRELRTLVDYGGGEPAIDSVFQAVADNYWTSSTFNADPIHAFSVGFQIDEGNTHEAKIDPFPVRAVRGGPR